jgi:hypothetical protein
MASARLAGCERLAPLALLLLTACASTLDVRTLATERADQSAYELTGRDLSALRREASLLCPQGGEILRQTARDQRLEAVDSRMERWVHWSSLWVAPPERNAQMVVLCKPVLDRHRLTAAAPVQPMVADSAAVTAVAPAPAPASGAPHAAYAPSRVASAPIGPLSVEW